VLLHGRLQRLRIAAMAVDAGAPDGVSPRSLIRASVVDGLFTGRVGVLPCVCVRVRLRLLFMLLIPQ